MIGGTSPDGQPLYIILNYQAGNYDVRNVSAEVNGKALAEWSWLVLTYGMKSVMLEEIFTYYEYDLHTLWLRCIISCINYVPSFRILVC